MLGLLGPNGAGKTTLVSLLAGLLTPDSGRILIANQPAQLGRRELALVPQEYAFYQNLTGRENLDYFAAVHGLNGSSRTTAITNALEETGLTDVQKQRASWYSGGLKRRLNIAIALLQQPQVLILDEPTANLDPQSRTFLLDMLRRLNKTGVTIIYTSHLLDEVENLCSTVAVLDQGKIRLQGTMADLLAEQHRVRIRLDENIKIQHLNMAGITACADNIWEFDLATSGISPAALLTQLEHLGIVPLQIHYGQRKLETVFMNALAKGNGMHE
jgi:ABC-2 type transport system ATP-binding protein